MNDTDDGKITSLNIFIDDLSIIDSQGEVPQN